MMKKLEGVAVIGGGYGDEGKGLMTDFWSDILDDPVVIRFNGGCQAGHTVVTPEGKRHVHSHFSCGTFTGRTTYLSKYFVVNPTLFRKEHEQFVEDFGIAPIVYISPDCCTTTPLEMLLNQTLETLRGRARHGSCGIGFGETLERVKRLKMPLRISYMANMSLDMLRVDMVDLLNQFILPRFDEAITASNRMDVDTIRRDFMEIATNRKLANDYYDDLHYLLNHSTLANSVVQGRNIIFEGAQGLEIDQDYGAFPYVSRSNCGMRNVTELINSLGLDIIDLTVNYVTRAYKTRHGAGPLPYEIQSPFPYTDETNVHNEWQGGLRWGLFRYDKYRSITDKDYALYADPYNRFFKTKRIDTMTHIDQLSIEAKREFEESMMHHFEYFSYGPTRDTIVRTNKR